VRVYFSPASHHSALRLALLQMATDSMFSAWMWVILGANLAIGGFIAGMLSATPLNVVQHILGAFVGVVASVMICLWNSFATLVGVSIRMLANATWFAISVVACLCITTLFLVVLAPVFAELLLNTWFRFRQHYHATKLRYERTCTVQAQ